MGLTEKTHTKNLVSAYSIFASIISTNQLNVLCVTDKSSGHKYKACWLKSDNKGKKSVVKDAVSGDWKCAVGLHYY